MKERENGVAQPMSSSPHDDWCERRLSLREEIGGGSSNIGKLNAAPDSTLFKRM